MSTDLAVRVRLAEGWRVTGQAQIDGRPPVPCVLTIRTDGSWSAQMATFTFAGEVDLFLVSAEGGHFCGPAAVASSRASTGSGMGTDLEGAGPLLVVAPETATELEQADMVDGEVIDQ